MIQRTALLSENFRNLGTASGEDLKGMRFGVPEEYMAEGMEEGVRKVFLASLEAFGGTGS